MNQISNHGILNTSVVQDSAKKPILSLPTESEEIEIDLLDLAYVLFDKIHYIIFAFLVGALILNAYSFFLIKPTYTSTSKLYMVSSSKDSVVDISDLNLGTSLTSDYTQLMLSYPVLDQVIDKLDLKMTSSELSRMIELVNPTSTRIININVTTTDPQLSSDIANTMAEVSVRYLPETMSTSAPNIAQAARVSTTKAGPSYLRFTLIGALLGLVVAVAIITILYLMDDTIHSSEELEKYFGIAALATIPENESLSSSDSSGKKSRRRHKSRRHKDGTHKKEAAS